MPIMRSAVLSGPDSGDLVPDLHGSVPESGDTHVSYCDGQPNPSMGSYFWDLGYTAILREKDTKRTFSKQPNINQSKKCTKPNKLQAYMHRVNRAACTEI